MMDWIDSLRRLRDAGKPAVLVTVLEARGSTPREAGAKMVVHADGESGTIGGGNLEFRSLRIARDLIGTETPVAHDFPLGPTLGQCCGGHARVLFEPIAPPGWTIALFGAGHVGKALVGLLGGLDCRVRWSDCRADMFPDIMPSNVVADTAVDVATLRAGAMVLVMTHDHQLDFEIVAAALERDDLPFVGLIGSATKRARFVSRLSRRGVDTSRLVCPIGIPGIGGKKPSEIAVAVAAQLLQLRGDMPVTTREPVVATCAGCLGFPR